MAAEYGRISLTVSDISSLFHTFPQLIVANVHATTSKISIRHSASPALAFMCGSNDNAQRGIEFEERGIELYTKTTGNIVGRRNNVNLTTRLELPDGRVCEIAGRLDGICEEKNIVIEHKYRVHGLLHYVPYHEVVQCQLYMFLTGIRQAHLVETFGNRIKVHELVFSTEIWARIIEALMCGRRLNQIRRVKLEEQSDGRNFAGKE